MSGAQDSAVAARACVFCAVAAGRAEASVVHEDETVVAFMDLRPVNPGHLLVVPRHAGDGWILPTDPPARDRTLLDRDAAALRDALATLG